MPNNASETQTLTSFRRKSGNVLKSLKRSKKPILLTVRGKASVVVQDAEGYQRLLDIAAAANGEEGLRQGLEDAERGAVRSARDFFAEFEAKHGLSR